MVVIKEKEKIVDIGSMVRNADPAYILPRGVTARVIVAGRGYCDVRSSNQKEFVNALLAIAWKDIEDMERHMGGPDRPSDPSDFNLDV